MLLVWRGSSREGKMGQQEVLEDMEGGFVIIQGDDMLGKAVNVLEGLGWGRRSVCRSLSSATAIVPHRFPSKATLTLSLIAGHQRPVAILLSSPLIINKAAFSFTWEAMPSENCYYCSNSTYCYVPMAKRNPGCHQNHWMPHNGSRHELLGTLEERRCWFEFSLHNQIQTQIWVMRG